MKKLLLVLLTVTFVACGKDDNKKLETSEKIWFSAYFQDLSTLSLHPIKLRFYFFNAGSEPLYDIEWMEENLYEGVSSIYTCVVYHKGLYMKDGTWIEPVTVNGKKYLEVRPDPNELSGFALDCDLSADIPFGEYYVLALSVTCPIAVKYLNVKQEMKSEEKIISIAFTNEMRGSMVEWKSPKNS